MKEYQDIPYIKDYKAIKPINKGWSEDRKFYIRTIDNKDLLLRVTDISKYDRKYKEFQIIKSLEDKNILMSSAIDFGTCNNGKLVYSLFTWINGEDAHVKLVTLSKKKQYDLGITAGEYLKKMHNISVPPGIEDWFERFNNKIDNKISSYKSCGIILEDDEKIIKYLEDNRYLLKSRPQSFQHGDYHVGNMIITPSNKLGIIDFNRFDYGDPWEEFNRITWCAEVSPDFASGYINGYFNNNVPDLFFRLMLLYISSNQIGSVSWAKSFGEGEVNTIISQTKTIVRWYNGFLDYIPSWYR
ncbi:phosphotransferase [Clostridium sp. SHJSY1]|uniref:aminoglycoside phosphotransferase family protein n=1 Tax=Clostridium sp. SHJSY1 TaxID=2942483 RepID=UPI002874F80C|nr:phosphotransferase [Clostridium sp. SHJSY1]MDS0524838.1 phosphotransferase [Clostridium sp. SHJSY1]